MKKVIKAVAAILAIIFIFCSCSNSSGEITGGNYMFVTGKNGGTYYSLGTAMASVWDKYSGSETTIISTTGSIDNIEMLVKGDADIALVQSDIFYYALNGGEMYKEIKQRGLSAVASLYTESVQIVVNAESEINTIEDLKGKSVAVGNFGTATEAAARQILDAYGITYDQITVRYQTFSEASKGLAAGTVDAAFAVSSLPSTNIYEYAQMRPIKFLPISVTNATKLKRSCPFFSDGVILSETYGTENSVATLCIDIMLICRSELSQDKVYSFTSSLFDNLDELASGHAKGSDIYVDLAPEIRVGNLHSGAKKYYDSLSAKQKSEEKPNKNQEPSS